MLGGPTRGRSWIWFVKQFSTWLVTGLPRSGKNRESQGIRKLRSRPLKVREFHTFYSKSGKSPWILYHLGSIRIIFVPVPTSMLRISFPVLTVHSHHFAGLFCAVPIWRVLTTDCLHLTSVFQTHYGTSVILSRRVRLCDSVNHKREAKNLVFISKLFEP